MKNIKLQLVRSRIPLEAEFLSKQNSSRRGEYQEEFLAITWETIMMVEAVALSVKHSNNQLKL